MPKSKAAGLQGFVTDAQQFPNESLACPQPPAHPGLLALVLWEPSGHLLPPARINGATFPGVSLGAALAYPPVLSPWAWVLKKQVCLPGHMRLFSPEMRAAGACLPSQPTGIY